MRIGLAQINPTVGDIAGNAKLILDQINAAKGQCDLIIFPELSLTGYPPEDLLLKPAFIQDNLTALKHLAASVHGIDALLGFVDHKQGRLYNAAAWISNRRIRGIYHKQKLPNYGVFDEERYFAPGPRFALWKIKGISVGITICEDLWSDSDFLTPLKRMKPDLVVNLSASPFHAGKWKERETVAKAAARALGAPVAYCNLVGGQDELVFDGGSFVIRPDGRKIHQAPLFKTGLTQFTFSNEKKTLGSSEKQKKRTITLIEEIHGALLLGLSDYVSKNRFQKVALGLSGGIDSALVAALAAKALGSSNVIGVTMPSRFNSPETVKDARDLARNLGIRLIEIPIENLFDSFKTALAPSFKGTTPNIAEENLQARIRGSLLMALSNKFGWLVLTTGNKSEMSTGYCTLYGDTAGGFAVIKDVLKTTVYALARFMNDKAGSAVIPASTLSRPPTAELRENQRDEDSLGAYADLDPLLIGYVEKNRPLADLEKSVSIKQISDKADYIRKIVSLVDKSEYKRRQAPPGIKITPRSFGRDHRMPITNRYTPS